MSAIIPAFNAERFVGDAIESVLGQTYPAVECVVVDDGSTDESAAVVHRYRDRVRYEPQENQGVSLARNRGAATAKGELLAFLDADDVWQPERLTRQVALIEGGSARAVLCAATVVDSEFKPRGVLRVDRPPSAESMLLQDGSLVSCSSNMLIARVCFDSLGGFDPQLSISADWDFLLRLLEREPLGYLDEPLVLYRRHEANMSQDIGAMERDMVLAYGAAFARKPEFKRIRRRAYGSLHWMLAGSYYEGGDRRACVRQLGRALRCQPALALRLGRAAALRMMGGGAE